MVNTTSKLFEYINQHRQCKMIRHEAISFHFSQLRKNVFRIISSLIEIDSRSNEIAAALRTRLSEWLTTPIEFNNALLDEIGILGPIDVVSRKWGADIGRAYEGALRSAESLSGTANPIRTHIGELILRSIADKARIKIFCHKHATQHFESILASIGPVALGNELFLHKSRDYAESPPFDILIKVGPLRPRGWGAVPDSILTVPRFRTLAQFVWSGSKDEEGFGFDPVSSTAIMDELITAPAESSDISSGFGISWSLTGASIGETKNFDIATIKDEDELQIFRKITEHQTKEHRAAVLVQIDGSSGVLYAENSQVLSYDIDADETGAFAARIPGETLGEGMFVITPVIGEIDVGSRHAKEGPLSPVWKKKLSESLEGGVDKFCERLFDNGLELLGLPGRVKDWCKASTTVIPAPKRRVHFEILLKELGLLSPMSQSEQLKWIQHAWTEIRRSRGEAITDGMVGREILDEKVRHILNGMKPTVEKFCVHQSSFQVPIPEGNEINGWFHFYKINSIENGYRAPMENLESITELKELDQWRV